MMKSRLTERIYCICGDLDDMICDRSLRKMTFNHYLSEYLTTKEHFDYVVFYLASRGMRVYDAVSAMELIGANRDLCDEPEEDDDDDLEFDTPIPNSGTDVGRGTGHGVNADRDSGRDTDTDRASGHDTDTDRDSGRNMDVDSAAACGSGSASGAKKSKKPEPVYFSRIETADFASLTDHRLRDTEKKTAIVFESLIDYMQMPMEDRAQFEATFQYFLGDSLDDNRNKVFFLAMNMDYNQIYAQIGNNDRLGGIFFQEQSGSPMVRREKFIEFGRPKSDEICNLLEYYRVYGHRKTYLDYPMGALRDLAYLLESYSVRARDASLDAMNRVLQLFLEAQEETEVRLTAEAIGSMYPRVKTVELPREKVERTDYAESVASRLRVLQRYQAVKSEHPVAADDGIARFLGEETKVTEYGCRFLLKGVEDSNRTKTAVALADFLYFSGEVFHDRHVIVRKESILQWKASEMERTIRRLVQEAANTVLILDDLDAMTELEDSKQVLRSFHRCLVDELNRDRGIHVIMVVNATKADAVFPEEKLAQYDIPEKNILELTKPMKEVPDEAEKQYRGDVADER